MSHQDAANTHQTEDAGAPTGARCAPMASMVEPIPRPALHLDSGLMRYAKT